MLSKLREEIHWVLIFLVTQLGVFMWNYRAFETTFFPVVQNFEIEHVSKQTNKNADVYVAFDKVRNCHFVGIRAYNLNGIRVNVEFLDEVPYGFKSRHVGTHSAGPWRVHYPSWSNIQIEAIHDCDPFGYTVTILQRIDILEDTLK